MLDNSQLDVKESKNFINLGVVRKGSGEILLVRRNQKEVGGDESILEWSFPGGRQRYSETREECVKRKILLRTGYDVVPERQISMRLHPQFLVMLVYHLCRLNQPDPIADPTESDEIAEIKWVKPEEIKNLITTDLDPKVAAALKIDLGV